MAQYRISFFIEFVIEIGYIVWTIIFFNVILHNIDSIAGWTRTEILFMVGLSIIFGELMTGLVYVWNTRMIPEKVRSGEMDFALTKPINSQFLMTASQIYPSSFVAIFVGFIMIFQTLPIIAPQLTIISILSGTIIFISSVVIGYCLLTILSSLTIVFIGAEFLTRISFDFFIFGSRPHQIYTGVIKLVFFFLIPIVFIASVPADVMLRGGTLWYVPLSILVAITFFIFTHIIWQYMITRYSSASS
jgi:ABC-2 type transport system permease protein